MLVGTVNPRFARCPTGHQAGKQAANHLGGRSGSNYRLEARFGKRPRMIARCLGGYNRRFRGEPIRASHPAGALMPPYQHVNIPAGGQKITVNKDFSLTVPDNAIVPFIEGDGTGVDITPVMIKVVDAAVAKAYGGKRKIHWMEIYAGEKSTKVYGPDVWLPEETLAILKES